MSITCHRPGRDKVYLILCAQSQRDGLLIESLLGDGVQLGVVDKVAAGGAVHVAVRRLDRQQMVPDQEYRIYDLSLT